jgi:hypothetical protein
LMYFVFGDMACYFSLCSSGARRYPRLTF